MTGPDIAMLALSAASTAASIKSQSVQRKAQAQKFAMDQQQQALQQRIQERKIERERKQTLSSQRARMGAAGIGGTGGSADAIFAGINQKAGQQVGDLRAGKAIADQGVNLLADDNGPMIQGLAGFGQQVVGVVRPYFEKDTKPND